MAILELGLLIGGVAGLAIGRWGGHQGRYPPITEVLPSAATQTPHIGHKQCYSNSLL